MGMPSGGLSRGAQLRRTIPATKSIELPTTISSKVSGFRITDNMMMCLLAGCRYGAKLLSVQLL
jgi:hypothetical protein